MNSFISKTLDLSSQFLVLRGKRFYFTAGQFQFFRKISVQLPFHMKLSM